MLLCPCFLFLALLASLFHLIPLIYYSYLLSLFFHRGHMLYLFCGKCKAYGIWKSYCSLGRVLQVSCLALSSASGSSFTHFLVSLGSLYILPLVLKKAHWCPIVCCQKSVCARMRLWILSQLSSLTLSGPILWACLQSLECSQPEVKLIPFAGSLRPLEHCFDVSVESILVSLMSLLGKIFLLQDYVNVHPCMEIYLSLFFPNG